MRKNKINPENMRREKIKRIKSYGRHKKPIYDVISIDRNLQDTDSNYANAVKRLETLHPKAKRIKENTWLLPQEFDIRVIRKKQLLHAYRMQFHSNDSCNHCFPAHYHYRMHSMRINGLMPPGLGGYYVCSKNKSHVFYILGPLSSSRCQVRGCNGRLRLM